MATSGTETVNIGAVNEQDNRRNDLIAWQMNLASLYSVVSALTSLISKLSSNPDGFNIVPDGSVVSLMRNMVQLLKSTSGPHGIEIEPTDIVRKVEVFPCHVTKQKVQEKWAHVLRYELKAHGWATMYVHGDDNGSFRDNDVQSSGVPLVVKKWMRSKPWEVKTFCDDGDH